MAGGGASAKAGNAASNAPTVSAAPIPAATDGEFLLHLLRQGINSGKIQRGVNTNNNNYMNKAMASSSASPSAEEEAWQLADPAVAALGPSHPLHTIQIHGNNNNSLHGALNSSHYQHYGNRKEGNSSPSSFDPLLRPAPNPYDQWPRPSPFVNFPEQFPKPYDKPLLPFPDWPFGGTPCAGGGASAHSHCSVNGPFALPGVQEAPWMAGGAGVARESGPWPLHSAMGSCVAQRLPPLLSGSDAVLAGSSEIYQHSFPGGGIRQLQKCEPRFSGNGADFFEHLRGLSGISENRFPGGSFVAPDDRDPCVGNLAVNGSQKVVGGNPFTSNLAVKANHKCVGRNDTGRIGLAPSHLGAAVAGERSNLSEACGDGYFRFGSIASHYEHDKCVPEGNPVNGIQQRDKKRFQMRSGDIILPKSDLPPKLQGEADVVRILARPSSNQRMSEDRTGLEGGVCREDLKVRDARFSARTVNGPITKLPREAISSSEQGISDGTTWLDRGRRETAVREGTALCTSNSYYMDEGRQAADREFSVQIRKDGSQNFVHRNRCSQSDLMQKTAARNGTVQWMVANARHDRESTKESTEVNENREILEMHSMKSWDGIIHKPHDDFKKYKGSQQEWPMKQLQAEDEMQSWGLDSFSTSVGHFSSLEANESGSCNINDGLNKCSSSQISQPDISSCSQLRAFQCENPGSPSGSRLHCAPASITEQSHKELHGDVVLLEGKHSVTIGRAGKHRVELTRGRYDEIDKKDADGLFRDLTGHLKLLDDNDSEVANDNRINLIGSRLCKDLDLDPHQGMLTANQHRRQWLMRPQRKEFRYRADLEILTPKFLLIYQSLIPQEEEEAKRKHLISCLEKLVSKEWPRAQLHLFGSCANSFGVSNSDIDVCLSIDDEQSSKPELVLKLADILQADNMRDVQALTHARVPIVKFTDPVTEISCDICINNILAVVNTKLLHDYAQIDVRLQQLAFMVKHWAKCRKINETYQGTLSSYAYVLMCIHFLQQRKPAILPCLQEMETTYQVTIGKIECAYYDQVDKLSNYGAENKDTLGQLLLAFFDYWAFRHDYTNSVISVRTGGLLSKNEKDWTRRVGNERHLICIEDPFETSHDLGRGVDKHSIRVLKEEFRRAAEIMQHDPDPCVTLFKPYIPVVGITSETDPR